MTNMNYLVFIWNVFVDTLLLLIVCAWKMYNMQTLHAGGIPMFRGTYLVLVGPAPANQAVSTPKPKTPPPPLPLFSLPEHTEPVALVDK